LRERRQVLLINPPSPPGSTANREGAGGFGVLYPSEGAFLYPAHTLASIAAVLGQVGYKVMVMDMPAWQGTPLMAARVVESRRWHGVLVYISYATLEHDLNFARFLRQTTPRLPIVLAGPAARFLPVDLPGLPADAVILGEPEKVLLEADESVFSGITRESAIFVGDGEDGFVDNLDSLPFPAWDLVPPGKGGFLTVYLSKGCPRRCSYCPYVLAQGGRIRARSLERVVQEIQWLAQGLSVNRVMFRDIAFARDGERVEALCRALIQKKLRVRWECESNPMDFKPELLELMHRAGCTEIKIGLETAHSGLLQAWGKAGSSEDAGDYLSHVAGLLETCRRIGMRCHLFLMVGAPGQNRDSINATLSYLRQVRPHMVNVKVFYPYPGIALEGATPDPRDTSIFSQLLRNCQAPAQNGQGKRFLPFSGDLLRKHTVPTARKETVE